MHIYRIAETLKTLSANTANNQCCYLAYLPILKPVLHTSPINMPKHMGVNSRDRV